MQDRAITFEVREIDAWLEPDGGWTENTSYRLGTFTTRADEVKRAFTAYLRKKHGITFLRSKTVMNDYGDLIEIVDRKTSMPLFCAVMIAHE